MFILQKLLDAFHAGLWVEQTTHESEEDALQEMQDLPPSDADLVCVRLGHDGRVAKIDVRNAFGGQWYPVSEYDFAAAFGGYPLDPGHVARVEIGKAIQWVPEKKSFLRFFPFLRAA